MHRVDKHITKMFLRAARRERGEEKSRSTTGTTRPRSSSTVHSQGLVEMLFDRAVLLFEWLFDAVSIRRTRITQRIVLSGGNAAAYADSVRAGFGWTLPDGMKRIDDALVRAERARGRDDR